MVSAVTIKCDVGLTGLQTGIQNEQLYAQDLGIYDDIVYPLDDKTHDNLVVTRSWTSRTEHASQQTGIFRWKFSVKRKQHLTAQLWNRLYQKYKIQHAYLYKIC